MSGDEQPGRWVWQPDDRDESFRRLVDWTLGPYRDRVREINSPGCRPERKAELHAEMIAEIEQHHREELARERERRPLWRDGHPPWSR